MSTCGISLPSSAWMFFSSVVVVSWTNWNKESDTDVFIVCNNISINKRSYETIHFLIIMKRNSWWIFFKFVKIFISQPVTDAENLILFLPNTLKGNKKKEKSYLQSFWLARQSWWRTSFSVPVHCLRHKKCRRLNKFSIKFCVI